MAAVADGVGRANPNRSPSRTAASVITTSDASGGLTTATIGVARTATNPATWSAAQRTTTAGSSRPA